GLAIDPGADTGGFERVGHGQGTLPLAAGVAKEDVGAGRLVGHVPRSKHHLTNQDRYAESIDAPKFAEKRWATAAATFVTNRQPAANALQQRRPPGAMKLVRRGSEPGAERSR